MRRTALLLVIAVCLIAITASSSAVNSALALSPAQKARFTVTCDFSHRAKDDPIVFPGKKGAAHSHDFFANRSTSANSTYESLRAARTKCNRNEDTAAYWLPTLYQDGRALTPDSAKIYYASQVDQESVKAFPRNLRMIAGDSKATNPQPTSVMSWACQGTTIDHRREPPRSCPEGSRLVVSLRFPNCWDGQHLDSADHKSHMTHSNKKPCPSTHPIRTPRIVMDVRYPTSKGTRLTFSSGSRYTGHADFINAWRQKELEALVRKCINDRRRTRDDQCNPPQQR
jgi:hypothetical protein